MSDIPQGLLLLDKPAGVTSFDCVAVVRRQLAIQRVGHCGTLDPAARGLLLILVGSATRTQDGFLGLEKEYSFRGEFGRKTTTGDLEGEITETRAFDHITMGTLQNAIVSFVGDSDQLPPLYSALKYKGKPYYSYARKGQFVPRLPRRITIHSFVLRSFSAPYWDARLVCSRGTYVRTLAEDVAARLNTCGTLVELVRERIGPYQRSQALSWERLRAGPREELLARLLPATMPAALAHA